MTRPTDNQRPAPTEAPSDRLNVLLDIRALSRPLKHRAGARVHIGEAETLARVLLWEGTEALPGSSVMAQLHLDQPIPAGRGDRFKVFAPARPEAIGGGTVLEPGAAPFQARDPAIVRRLRALGQGDHAGAIRAALATSEDALVPLADLADRAGLASDEARAAVETLVASGDVRILESAAIDAAHLEALRRRWTRALAAYHKRAPLRPGMPVEELRGQGTTRLTPAAFHALLATLAEDGALVVERGLARLPDFAIRLRPDQEETVREILALYREGGWHPPGDHEVLRALGPHRATREMWDHLTATGRLLPLAENLHLHGDVAGEGISEARRLLVRDGRLTVGAFRDAVGASRRTAVPFLEWCDARRLTRRSGDVRLAGPALRSGPDPGG